MGIQKQGKNTFWEIVDLNLNMESGHGQVSLKSWANKQAYNDKEGFVSYQTVNFNISDVPGMEESLNGFKAKLLQKIKGLEEWTGATEV